MKLILKNARLVPYLTEGYEERYGDVIIEGEKIETIVPCAPEAEDCEIYDLQGKTLLPGMIDLHMHLYFFTADFNRLAVESNDQNQVLLHGLSYAKEFLRQGFTTVRDCGNQYDCGLAVRKATESRLIEGPRVYTAGQCITPSALGNDTFPALYDVCNTPQEVYSVCRQQAARGIDLLKYIATGAVANAAGKPGMLITTKEELTALKRASEDLYLPAAAHCHGKEGILLCADVGIATIEHASDIDEECTERILKHSSRSAIVPTLGPIALMMDGRLDEAVSAKIKRMESEEAVHPMVQASRAGVLTGWGTDISKDFFAAHPGCEFLLRKNRGYTEKEILQQATINSARILGISHKLGTIAKGKLADFAVIDGKPDEDISAMERYPAAVFKEGRLVCEREDIR